jgi:hypothetical protein
LTDENKKEIVETVRQTLVNYHADIRKDGFIAELTYLDDSDDFFWVPPGYAAPITYDSVRAVLKQNAPLYESVNNNWDTLMVIAISKDYATFAGRFSSVMTDTAGKITEFQLIESGLLVKRKSRWKLLSGQTKILNN